MCGIFALNCKSKSGLYDRQKLTESACESMASRGPDAQGIWNENDLFIGHRRLAIIDLDARANQPMMSICGRYVIVMNGEIYNYCELRKQREAHGDKFKTNSDTEVVAALFAAEGATSLLQLRGMFAFFIWDRHLKKGFAARDPYGIKPLYYTQLAKGWMLSSQVKAIAKTGLVTLEDDLAAQAGFWLTGSVPEPRTWFKNISALPAGHYMWFDDDEVQSPICWWDIRDAWRQAEHGKHTEFEVVQNVKEALRESVSAHLVSDVPIGVFLSGGIDSGVLTGLMAEEGVEKIAGITIAFNEYKNKSVDEVPLAKTIAEQYGVRHIVRIVSNDEFKDDLAKIISAMDQPSIDGVNTWFASKAAHEAGLKVVVSGVGGDELFQGYPSFDTLPKLVRAWSAMSQVYGFQTLAEVLCNLQARRSSNKRWAFVPKWSGNLPTAWLLKRGLFAPTELPSVMGHERAIRALEIFNPEEWINDISNPIPENSKCALSLIESVTYLRNQLLRDSDWASMAHSVELRTPLVDSFLLKQLTPYLNSFSDFPNKALLTQSTNHKLPDYILNRKKTGFNVPVNEWLGQNHQSSYKKIQSRAWALLVARSYN